MSQVLSPVTQELQRQKQKPLVLDLRCSMMPIPVQPDAFFCSKANGSVVPPHFEFASVSFSSILCAEE